MRISRSGHFHNYGEGVLAEGLAAVRVTPSSNPDRSVQPCLQFHLTHLTKAVAESSYDYFVEVELREVIAGLFQMNARAIVGAMKATLQTSEDKQKVNELLQELLVVENK